MENGPDLRTGPSGTRPWNQTIRNRTIRNQAFRHCDGFSQSAEAGSRTGTGPGSGLLQSPIRTRPAERDGTNGAACWTVRLLNVTMVKMCKNRIDVGGSGFGSVVMVTGTPFV